TRLSFALIGTSHCRANAAVALASAFGAHVTPPPIPCKGRLAVRPAVNFKGDFALESRPAIACGRSGAREGSATTAHTFQLTRRHSSSVAIAAGLIAGVFLVGSAAQTPGGTGGAEHWVGTWATAVVGRPQAAPAGPPVGLGPGPGPVAPGAQAAAQ